MLRTTRIYRIKSPLMLVLSLALSLMLVSACAPAPESPATGAAVDTTSAPAPTAAPAEEAQTGSDDALPAGEQTYVIDASASTAYYIVQEEFFADALSKYGIPAGLGDTIGSTQAIEGSFTLNWSDLSATLGENTFSVDLSTLSSDQGLRDGWMRTSGPNFGRYPDAIFVASSIEGAPDSYTLGEEVTFNMVGELTVREITQPATFVVTAALANGVVTGVADANVTMSDFGIDPPNFANTLTVADDFVIRVEFTARAQ